MRNVRVRATLLFLSACLILAFQNCSHGFNAMTNGLSSSQSLNSSGGFSTTSAPLSVTIQNVSIVPGDAANLTITLSVAQSTDLELTFTTADGTAIAGTNYTAASQTPLTIPAGTLTGTASILTSSTAGVSYLGKSFSVNFVFPTAPNLNQTANVSFSAAPMVVSTATPYKIRDKWAAFPANSTSPSPRAGHSAIWTGTKMIIWGGYNGSSYLRSGAAYDPETNSWTPLSTTNAPSARDEHVAVWTGTKMIIWGGYSTSGDWKSDGAIYDPSTDTWSALPQSGSIPSARAGATGVWDGSELIVWGGYDGTEYVNDGAAYDPTAGTWAAIATSNAPSPRYEAKSVWTGAKMIVWSGAYELGSTYNYFNDGAAYDPVANTWTPISSVNAPSVRGFSTAAWTGSQLVSWSGYIYSTAGGAVEYDDGALYDPSADAWSSMSMSNAPSNRSTGASVWTGSSFLTWGGFGAGTYYNDGGIYF